MTEDDPHHWDILHVVSEQVGRLHDNGGNQLLRANEDKGTRSLKEWE